MKHYSFLTESTIDEDPEIVKLINEAQSDLKKHGYEDDLSILIHKIIGDLKRKVSKKNKENVNKYIQHLQHLLTFDSWGGFIDNDIWIDKIFTPRYFKYVCE